MEYIKKAVTYPKRILLECDDASSLLLGNKVIGLADWCNVEIKIKSTSVDEDGNMTHLRGVLSATETEEFEQLTWLPATAEPIHLSLVEFDHLISKNKLDAGKDVCSQVSGCTKKTTLALGDSGDILMCSKKETLAFGDSDMCNVQQGDILMLTRKGFFRCDVPFKTPSHPIVLIEIPTGALLKPRWSLSI